MHKNAMLLDEASSNHTLVILEELNHIPVDPVSGCRVTLVIACLE